MRNYLGSHMKRSGERKTKLKIKELGKTFDVKATNKNMRKVYQLQLDMNKVATLEDDNDPMAMIQAQLDATTKVEDFIVTVLKLNAKEQEKLDDMESEETIMMSQRISMKLLGMSDKDIEEALTEDDTEDGQPSK